MFASSSEGESKAASRAEREALGVFGDVCLVYGEIAFASFRKTLLDLRLPPGGTFVDLGSGSGEWGCSVPRVHLLACLQSLVCATSCILRADLR